MPVKLFPLHLRFLPAAMKPNPVLRSSRVMPVQSIVFPHKLKYHNIGPSHLKRNLLQTQVLNGAQFGVCKFSTRSGQGMQASKTLIEDEAELSDWVSGLSSNSFKKTRLHSDSEKDVDSNVENGGYQSRGRGGKRPRGREFDKDSEFRNLRGGGRSSSERRPGIAWERRAENESAGSSFGRGGRGGRGRDSSEFFSRRERGEFGPSLEEKNKREWDNKRRDSLFSRRNNDSREGRRENDGRSEKKSEMRNEEGGRKFGGRLEGKSKSNHGLFDSRNDLVTSKRWRENGERREKKPEMWNGRNIGGVRGGLEMKREGRGRGTGTGTGRRSIVFSNGEDKEEEKEKAYMSFKELIDSEEEDDDDDDDDDEEEEEEVEVVVAEEEEDEEEGAGGLVDKGSVISKLEPSSPGKNDSYLSESRFDQCSISPLSLKGIKDAGYERMTQVQEATLPVILKGKDVLAKAKTGTGKTVAFLLPAIELVVQSPPITGDQKRPPILVLVICPTRELASQAAAEANTLLKYHPSIGVQVVIGGTRLPLEQKRMQANPCQILVATPGRLRDHIENTAGFATRLMGVKVLVLDEADHLLDMGFRKEIEKIIAAVPKQRQTLLFSATIPQEVRQICHIALKRDHEFINTVEEGSEDTHSQVRQTHLVAPLDKHFSLLYTLLKEHVADDVNYKILVFCTTAMVTRLVAEFLSELKLNVREIHSRKPQSYRTRISDEFRKSKGLILVTSDVSARGVDYPDVTLVVQIGVPSDRQQYIHRLGRTGRKGKEGQGVLLLAPWEEFFLSGVKDLPISKASEPLVDPETRKKVERALSHIEMKNKESAYQAWLGYYNSNKNVGRDKYKLVELANEFSRSMGLDNPPAIPKLVLGKMGLKNIPGLRSK